MKTHLKMKICSLAAEAKIIRREEHKWKKRRRPEVSASLREHRTGIVRREARHSHLAYGLLRGRTYAMVEQPKSRPADWNRVSGLVAKYGGLGKDEASARVREWRGG